MSKDVLDQWARRALHELVGLTAVARALRRYLADQRRAWDLAEDAVQEALTRAVKADEMPPFFGPGGVRVMVPPIAQPVVAAKLAVPMTRRVRSAARDAIYFDSHPPDPTSRLPPCSPAAAPSWPPRSPA